MSMDFYEALGALGFLAPNTAPRPALPRHMKNRVVRDRGGALQVLAARWRVAGREVERPLAVAGKMNHSQRRVVY